MLSGIIGVFFVVTGAWGVLSPRKALESNYRWDRFWARVYTLGRIDPEPRPLTDRAVRSIRVAGVVFVVGGAVLVAAAIANAVQSGS